MGLKKPDKLTYKKVKNMIADVATQPIERPVEEQEKAYNGKKRHIIKSQIIINEKNGKILHCQLEKQGAKSDLKVFEKTPLGLHPKIKLKADLGYQGIV